MFGYWGPFCPLRDIKPENLLFRHRPQTARASPSPQQRQQQQQEQPWQDQDERATGGEEDDVSWPLCSMEEQHELLLIDFDTSMFIRDTVEANCDPPPQQRRRLVGTYGYLAPEVLKAGRYTCASDIWSVGVILYILMTVS